MGIEEDMKKEGWSPREAMESPALFGEMTESLSRQRSVLARELDKGVAPEAFKRGKALLSAYDAALTGVERARERCAAQG